ncbi:MAG: hypothetical protein AB7I30_21170 [Isosphaeraceae bacterium]
MGVLLSTLVVVAALASGTRADDPAPSPESAALAFVREHHPELVSPLAMLKSMRPDAYDKAIRELGQVSRSLGNLKARDPRRYELGLELWKARSRVDLLTARLAAADPRSAADLESPLREAVEAQLAVEIRQQRFERDQVEARLRRLTENLRKLESDPKAVAEGRYQALLKKGQRARRSAMTDKAKVGSRAVSSPAPAVPQRRPSNPNPGQGKSR